jgi:hypothetical protein
MVGSRGTSAVRGRLESACRRVTALEEMAYGGSMYQSNRRPDTGCVMIERW